MIILTSPSKTQDEESTYPAGQYTSPLFLSEAKQIADTISQWDRKTTVKRMNVSESLAEQTYVQYQRWLRRHTKDETRPAIYTYTGDIFKQLEVQAYNKAQLEYMQRSLRILSALYGVVRPYDKIAAYRLEMKTKLKGTNIPNLVRFWKPKVTVKLEQELAHNLQSWVLDLSSQEYGQVVGELRVPVIRVEFKEQRGSTLRTIAIYTKYARGMMIDWCIRQGVVNQEQLKSFDCAGYRFVKQGDASLLFTRTSEQS